MDNQTLYDKLSIVPTAIKSQLGSEASIDELDSIETKFHLPNGSFAVIAKIIQRIEIKDLDAGYFAGTLAVELELDRNKAMSISEEIKKVIFGPIRNEFQEYGVDISLLDKFQMPEIKAKTLPVASPIILTSESTQGRVSVSADPKMLSQIVEPKSNTTASSAVGMIRLTPSTSTMPMTPTSAPKPATPPVPPSPAPKPLAPSPTPVPTPTKLNQTTIPTPAQSKFSEGWSTKTQTHQIEPIKLTSSEGTAMPKPSATIPTPPSKQIVTPNPAIAILPTPIPAPVPVPKPSITASISAPTPAKPPMPAPVILHESTISGTPLQKNTTLAADFGKRDQMTGSQPVPQPTRPAIVEIGTATGKSSTNSTTASATTPQTGNGSPQIAPSGPRTITEVTAPPPKPPQAAL